MGVIRLNNKTINTDNVRIVGNLLIHDGGEEVFCDRKRRVQVLGNDISTKKLYVDNCVYVVGAINRASVGNCSYVFGRCKDHKADNREYKTNAESEIRRVEIDLSRRYRGEKKRCIVPLYGAFDSVSVDGPDFTMAIETYIIGSIDDATVGNCLFVRGNVDNISVGNCLYFNRD